MFLKVSRSFKKTFSIFVFSLLIFAVAATALAVDYQPLDKPFKFVRVIPKEG